MKKIWNVLLVSSMAMALTACGGQKAAENGKESIQTSASSESTTASAESTTAEQAAAQVTEASAYKPEKTITCFAPYAVGGGVDALGRELTAMLTATGITDVTYIYENVGGSAGQIGLGVLIDQHKGDETYIVPTSSTYLMNGYLQGTGSYGYKDLTLIARLYGEYRIYVVPGESEINTLQDLIELGGTRELVASTSGVGGASHIALAALAYYADIPMRCVPLDGSDDTMALLGNQVDVGFMGLDEAIPYLESGELKGIAVTTPERISDLEDIPTTKELGYPELNFCTSRGFAMPANVSPECVEYWENVFKKLVDTPEFEAHIASNYSVKGYMNSREFLEFTEKEYRETEELLKAIGLYE